MMDRFFFAPDDGGQGGGDAPIDSGSSSSFEGAADAASAGDLGGTPLDGGATQAPQPFFEIEDEKGKRISFNSADELKEAWKRSGMLRSDYTRKTQDLSEERKKFERERETLMSEIMSQKQRFDKMNDWLRNNPHIYRQIEESMKKGTTGDVAVEKARAYVDEQKSELQKELDDLKNWRRQRELNEQRDRIYKTMGERYPDFSREQIQSLMEEVDPSNMESLIELMYHASRGRSMGLEQQTRMARAQERKQAARMVPGGGAPVQSSKDASSLDEAYDMALREIQSG